MFTIGEFSRITSLSVKTLRFYHEKQVLNPSRIDSSSGYRYYDHNCIEKAHIICLLRNLQFPLNDIKDILDNYDDQADILDYLQLHKQTIESKIRQHENIVVSLENIITAEKEAVSAMNNSSFQVEEKTLDPILIAAIRMKGKYSDCGKAFATIGKKLGRYISGKPFCLYYDDEYREDDADFEACMPIRQAKETPGISIRQLPGGKCAALIHKGPYETLGPSYAKIFEWLQQRSHEIVIPCREVYLKGPGLILKGNPKRYLTEIQILMK